MRNLLHRPFSSLLLMVLWTVPAGAEQPKTPQMSAVDNAGRSTLSAESPVRQCRLRVRSLQSRRSRRFSATKILDLDFHVRFAPDLAGEHLVRVDIETPAGHLFQTLTLPFGNEASRSGTARAVEGFPHPVTVHPARAISRRGRRTEKEVVGRLPVAGTPIVHSSLYGKWTAKAYLDDGAEPCGRARAFLIRP